MINQPTDLRFYTCVCQNFTQAPKENLMISKVSDAFLWWYGGWIVVVVLFQFLAAMIIYQSILPAISAGE